MNIYFDNAATTQLDKRVLDEMIPFMVENYGNPSSIHKHGREVKTSVENSRNKIADILGVTPGEIFFTSGGTEADNTFIINAIYSRKIKTAITSKIEHHAVLHTLEDLEKKNVIKILYVNLDSNGHIDYNHLEELISSNPKSLISLMHGNNEIGNITNIERVAEVCNSNDSIFHSDTVQTIGHFNINLSSNIIHSIVGSAHKFHGPKGIGFMYINNKIKIPPYIIGGSQERNMRGGTENVSGIIGLSKAFEITIEEKIKTKKHIENLKFNMIEMLKRNIKNLMFNGDCDNSKKSLFHVLSLSIPKIEDKQMFLFNLDINKISVSAGSACSSGSSKNSHVLEELKLKDNHSPVRISFSKLNTMEEVNYVVEKIVELQKIS